jgi:hypothetical protein
MIRLLQFSMIVAFLAFSLPAAAQVDDLAYVEGGEDLERVKRAKFRETYVNTGVDFSRYDKLYLGDAYFDYRDAGPAERSRSAYSTYSSRTVFGISEVDRQEFERIVEEAFTKEIVKGKNFTVTDSVDDETIIMRGAVVDIVSKVPPEYAGRSEIYLASVGEATLVLEFFDGKSGEVLARVSERGVIGRGRLDEFSMPVNRATVTGDIRRWAGSAARRLRSELDSALGG